MARPIVALVTDFGMRDHYVAAMKGVILGICPDVTLVDITHSIPPQDIQAGLYEIVACYRYFPSGTVFLVVVDPGVGSPRRALAAEAGGYRFLAPDNGVLTGVFEESPPRRVVELSERRYARPTVSRTFEGRDRFAPAAGWLAKGVDLSALGRPLAQYEMLPLPKPTVEPGRSVGEVRRVDYFGNLITNIDKSLVDRLAERGGHRDETAVRVTVGGHVIPRLVATYGQAAHGEVCALIGSSDHLEIAVNGASASDTLQLGRGATVTVTSAEESDAR